MIDIEDTLATFRDFGFSESYHVTTFRVVRNSRTRGDYFVTVEIHDSGPREHSTNRYRCVVRDDNGIETSGNAADSIRTALAIVHWDELD